MERRSFIQKALSSAALLCTVSLENSVTAFANHSSEFTLPPLAYSYAALEPYIDAQTMEIHHGKHHETYIKNLNKEVASNNELKNKSLEDILKNISKYNNAVKNNAGGHYNHSLFWTLLSNKAGTPSPALSQALNRDFTSLEKFKELFNEAAKSRFGSGWAWLIYAEGKLKITSTPNQDNPLMDATEVKGFPLLALDVWEHAYYLKYQNRRPEYIDAFWNVVNWNEVNKRFESTK
jgi:Fe-Mn family superoxide dismutase